MTIEQMRENQLIKCIPDIWDYDTLLYIGARPIEGTIFVEKFNNKGYIIDLIEAFQKNCDDLIDTNFFDNIYCDDIRVCEIIGKYDVIMWYHGPEHVSKEDGYKIIEKLEKHYNKLLILGCPYGVYNQGICYNNTYEIHQSAWYPEDFIEFEVDTIGIKDQPSNNILAWKGK